jgi:aminoglycoside/choline kinase family phosphotransferase
MIHRDFQSQNILIHNCEVRIVDFQGARIGHIAYDLMSLLNDPYIALDKDLRLSLSEYFFNSIAETPLLEKLLEKKALRSITSIVQSAALQRGMQALGAYAFLSIEKGKTSYRKFIPPALKILNETLEDRDEYPNLKRVLKSLTRRFYAG